VSKFPVIQIPVSSDRDFETHPEGAIAKYWQDLPSLGRSLVKADLRGAWVEKVTATLAERIGLPVAGCELVERADGLKMIASPNFLETGVIERAGESLLEDRFGINYPYTVDGTLTMNGLTDRLLELKPEAANFWIDRISNIDRSLIEETIDRLPEDWTIDIRTAFAIDLLAASRDRLVTLARDRSQIQSQSPTTDRIATSSEEIERQTPGRRSS
jgi:hypothetical protein